MDIEKKQLKLDKSLLTMYSTQIEGFIPLTVEAGTTNLDKFEQGVPDYAQLSVQGYVSKGLEIKRLGEGDWNAGFMLQIKNKAIINTTKEALRFALDAMDGKFNDKKIPPKAITQQRKKIANGICDELIELLRCNGVNAAKLFSVYADAVVTDHNGQGYRIRVEPID